MKRTPQAQALQLDAMQGRVEQRSEPYIRYGERVAENLTQQCAKSNSGVASFADESAVAVQRMRND